MKIFYSIKNLSKVKKLDMKLSLVEVLEFLKSQFYQIGHFFFVSNMKNCAFENSYCLYNYKSSVLYLKRYYIFFVRCILYYTHNNGTKVLFRVDRSTRYSG